MINKSKEHLNDTENPQTYWQHFNVAFFQSCYVVKAGLQGIVHAFIPCLWPFKTSTCIIKCTKILIDTRRHKDEFRDHLGEGYINPEHMEESNEKPS